MQKTCETSDSLDGPGQLRFNIMHQDPGPHSIKNYLFLKDHDHWVTGIGFHHIPFLLISITSLILVQIFSYWYHSTPTDVLILNLVKFLHRRLICFL